MNTIYLVVRDEEDYRQIITTPLSAHPTRADALAEAARLDIEVAWASNQPDFDGGKYTHCVYGIPMMSTPLDNAPLHDPPSELNLPHMSPAAFLQLVRDYKIRVETPNGDSSRVHIARVVGDTTVIGWDYEGPVDGEYVDLYGGLSIRPDTQPLRNGDTITIGMEAFTITQEP